MSAVKKTTTEARLYDLVRGLVELSDSDYSVMDKLITGIQIDSRFVRKSDLFIACFGRNHDARNYIDLAIESGCAAVLAEFTVGMRRLDMRSNVPVIGIDNLPSKVSEIASRFFQFPSSKLGVIGITGTNGKTSCSQFIANTFQNLGYKCGMIGTLGAGLPDCLEETQLTTPDAVYSQKKLAEMASQNVEYVAMEASSVGLHQKRVEAIKFDTAIFTNLTRDHLDYHRTMSDYGESKKKLFKMSGLKSAILNLDDDFALSIINSIPKEVEILTYSIANDNAAIFSKKLTFTNSGYSADIHTPIGVKRVSGKLIGYFNFSNILAVIAVLISTLRRRNTENLELDKILEQVSLLAPVDGRMEIVDKSHEVIAIVDYAHTPASLRCALTTLKDHFKGKIWCVFGCGGNRDEGKRPIMGEIAEANADHLVLTDDNPRDEAGDRIVSQILSGVKDPSKVSVIRDRASAIEYAISNAASTDVVLIAGKGHETYQDISGNKTNFNDRTHAKIALKDRRSSL